jgi:hypothetical protein
MKETALTKQAAIALSQVVDLPRMPTSWFSDADVTGLAANWNNMVERTAQEVIDAMRLAATVYAKIHVKVVA